jgi:CubicO group peptidase (beta-lactamase class C family)
MLVSQFSVMGPRRPVALLCLAAWLGGVCAADWSGVDNVLSAAVQNRSFPGCVAVVGGQNGTWYAKAFGSFTYGLPAPASGSNPAVDLSTLYDIASLTKVSREWMHSAGYVVRV